MSMSTIATGVGCMLEGQLGEVEPEDQLINDKDYALLRRLPQQGSSFQSEDVNDQLEMMRSMVDDILVEIWERMETRKFARRIVQDQVEISFLKTESFTFEEMRKMIYEVRVELLRQDQATVARSVRKRRAEGRRLDWWSTRDVDMDDGSRMESKAEAI